MNNRQITLYIRTPEGITFSLPLASPLMRFWALAVDMTLIAVVSSVLKDFFKILGQADPGISMAIFILINFILNIGYAIIFEWFYRGQTVGKRVFRLRVLDAEGKRLQFSQVAIRNLLRPVDAMPLFYLVGGIACFLSPRCQRLGDMVANTVVVRSPEPVLPDLDEITGQTFNSMRTYPHLAGRLRQKVTPEEAQIALQAIVRRNSLDDHARIQLFDLLSDHFQSKVTYPEEALLGLTSEHYIRNVLDIVYKA